MISALMHMATSHGAYTIQGSMLNYTQTEQTTKLHKHQHHKGPQPSMNDDDQFKRQLSMKNDRKKISSFHIAYTIYLFYLLRNIYTSKIVPSKSCFLTPEPRVLLPHLTQLS